MLACRINLLELTDRKLLAKFAEFACDVDVKRFGGDSERVRHEEVAGKDGYTVVEQAVDSRPTAASVGVVNHVVVD